MQTIFFDLDGTLIDHFSAIHRGVAHAQRSLGLPESDYATVRATVGGSVPVTLGKLCGAEYLEAAEPLFREHFSEIMFDDVEVLPGAVWLLRQLKATGRPLAVFTNKYENDARATLERLGLAGYFDEIIGADSRRDHRKPFPKFTMYALERMNCASNEAVMIGDSPFDFAAAEADRIECHLVATGSHDKERLAAETNAAGIYKDLYELGEAVFNLTPETSRAT